MCQCFIRGFSFLKATKFTTKVRKFEEVCFEIRGGGDSLFGKVYFIY